MDRHRKQLELVLKPETKPRGEALPADVLKGIDVKEEEQEDPEPPHFKENQEDPEPPHIKEEPEDPEDPEDPEPQHIKEEQEELWISQEGEQLQGQEEADITKFPFSPVPVKSEDDEEKPQSSELHQRLTEQMETEADGEDCGGPEPDRDSHPDTHLQPDTEDKTGDSSELETDDSDDDWKETREPQSGLNSLKNYLVPVSDLRCAGEKRFSCSVCGKKFGVRGDLKKHTRTHTGEKPFICSVCKKSFSQSGSLQSHMKIHTGEKPFSCPECGKRFGRKDYLKTHMTTHTGEKPFTCSICKKSFTVIGSFQRHMRIHTGERRYSCSVCGERFIWYNQLRIHQCVCRPSSQLHQTQTEQIKTEADGEDCGGPEPARNSRPDTHLQPDTEDKTGDSSEPETDDSDDWRETREPQSGLKSLKNDKVREKPFSCSECHEISEDSHNLMTHMKFHIGDKQFSCSVCNAGFSDSETLVHHMRIHTIQTQFSCPVCCKEFAWRRYLTKHMEVHKNERIYRRRYFHKTFSRHRQVKRHKCDGCKSSERHQSQTEVDRKAEPPASSSTQQMKTEADGEDCGGPEPDRNSEPDTNVQPDTDDSVDSDFWKETKERLSSLKSLKTDKVSVCDERCKTDKSLSCSDCGKSSCVKRQRRPHTGEKPFSCSVCAKTFARRTNVTQHMRIHTGEKKFSCSVCNRRFAWRLQIKKHKCVGQQSSQPHQSKTVQIKTESDRVDCGGPEPARNSHPGAHLQPDTEDKTEDSSDPETEDSDDWRETREPQSGLNSLKNDQVTVSYSRCSAREKPFCCSECGKRFVSKGSLKIHVRTHTGEKPFVCTVCGKGFHRKDNLVQHMRSHTEEKPFSCPFCQKSFTQGGNLQTHMRVHTGEKRYSCSVCDQRFTWLYQLRNHQCAGCQKS